MQQLKTYGDERTLAFCAFCGGKTGTRDHCPSRVLLDEPYPENLPVVPACQACNTRFSSDEEYLACLLGCVLAGSTDPAKVRRAKIKRILEAKPALTARIEAGRNSSGGDAIFSIEESRVRRVVTKLAQGHSLFELHELCLDAPEQIWFKPFVLMTNTERDNFESPEPSSRWPEVGSRAMQRIVETGSAIESGWLQVQPENYRYLAEAGAGISIRIVISEYLACQVRW